MNIIVTSAFINQSIFLSSFVRQPSFLQKTQKVIILPHYLCHSVFSSPRRGHPLLYSQQVDSPRPPTRWWLPNRRIANLSWLWNRIFCGVVLLIFVISFDLNPQRFHSHLTVRNFPCQTLKISKVSLVSRKSCMMTDAVRDSLVSSPFPVLCCNKWADLLSDSFTRRQYIFSLRPCSAV
jgi:hypothetical protein